jgi:tetratricopeptide (TPR) repeat protein
MSYPNDISDKEVDALKETLHDYPYFQLGHSLLAKAKHDKQTPDAYEVLSHAAIFAPNRRMLRKLFYEDLHIDQAVAKDETDEEPIVIETDKSPISAEDTPIPDISSLNVPESYDPPLEEEIPTEEQDKIMESDEVYNELEENLRKLRESKHKFSEEEEEEDKKKTPEVAIQPDSISTEQNPPQTEEDDDVAPLLSEYVDKSEHDTLPLAHNQQQQNELIDRFINSQDTISLRRNQNSETETEEIDLSQESSVWQEEVITENLADIYVRQGKLEKAIEIYTKLIWKFPQKKTYFAGKIENLKSE